MTNQKWYSNGLKQEEALKLEKKYARLYDVCYGMRLHKGELVLEFKLKYEDGTRINSRLKDKQDIEQLFNRTGRDKLKTFELEGIIIETYNEGRKLRGISVNPNLIDLPIE